MIFHHEPRDDWPECYTASSHQVYIPGNYDSPRTARYAFRFPDATLWQLERDICHAQRRPITADDLRAARAATKEPS